MLDYTNLQAASDSHYGEVAPPQTPVSSLDITRSAYPFDMDLPMSDPCERCGAFRLTVGYWVCVGMCDICLEKALEGSECN